MEHCRRILRAAPNTRVWNELRELSKAYSTSEVAAIISGMKMVVKSDCLLIQRTSISYLRNKESELVLTQMLGAMKISGMVFTEEELIQWGCEATRLLNVLYGHNTANAAAMRKIFDGVTVCDMQFSAHHIFLGQTPVNLLTLLPALGVLKLEESTFGMQWMFEPLRKRCIAFLTNLDDAVTKFHAGDPTSLAPILDYPIIFSSDDLVTMMKHQRAGKVLGFCKEAGEIAQKVTPLDPRTVEMLRNGL